MLKGKVTVTVNVTPTGAEVAISSRGWRGTC